MRACHQWDILLVEVGFASILYAPWALAMPARLRVRLPSVLGGGNHLANNERNSEDDDEGDDDDVDVNGRPPPGPTVWPLRFVLFKLMLMSGVVKVQARCPTWLRLTALE